MIVKEAWLISIANGQMKFKGKLMRAQVLQARENTFLNELKNNRYASCTIFSLEEALNAPGLVLQAAQQVLEPGVGKKPTVLPQLKDLSKLDAIVRKLGKNGVSLNYRPSKKKRKAPELPERAVSRPYVVR